VLAILISNEFAALVTSIWVMVELSSVANSSTADRQSHREKFLRAALLSFLQHCPPLNLEIWGLLETLIPNEPRIENDVELDST
jgi:hypothetical protein